MSVSDSNNSPYTGVYYSPEGVEGKRSYDNYEADWLQPGQQPQYNHYIPECEQPHNSANSPYVSQNHCEATRSQQVLWREDNESRCCCRINYSPELRYADEDSLPDITQQFSESRIEIEELKALNRRLCSGLSLAREEFQKLKAKK